MNFLQTSVLLFVAFLVVFLQSTVTGLRLVTGAQIDLLPSLMVYAGLHGGLGAITALAILGGLMHDSLSANALGISILPLFAVGAFIHYHRGMILKEASFARFILGLGASALVPVATLILLSNTERQPLVGWFFIWQLFVMSILGGLLTPLWFRFFDWATGLLSYRAESTTSFRPDRQIKRGR
jgi:cell shape-determining protein MreD